MVWAAVVVVLCGCTSLAGRWQIGGCAENADDIPGQCAGQKILRDSQAVDMVENGCFNKGSQIAIQGRIQTGSYEANDGTRRYTTDVVVDRFEFIGSGGQNDNQGIKITVWKTTDFR